jgi:endoglucanase
MQDTSLTFLKNLLACVGPSGYEQEPARLWRQEAEGFGAETWTDLHGNSFARLNKGGTPRVMLAVHLDEIGFMVTYIDDDGFVAFQPVGGWDSQIPQGQRVWLQGREGRVPGVIGKKPIHLLKPDERDKVTKIEDMWIDIGARDKDEASTLVSVGDPVVLAWEPQELRNSLLVSRGFDNRAGAFVVLEALRSLSQRDGLACEVTAVGTVQEEIGLRGARTAAFSLEPQVGIAVDVTFATDHPGMDDMKKRTGHVEIGGGPVISRGANINPLLFDRLVDAAESNDMRYQVDPAPGGTGTDANAMQVSRGGVATALISVPNRYMHSPCELCSLDDLEGAARLIAEAVARMDAETDLRVV